MTDAECTDLWLVVAGLAATVAFLAGVAAGWWPA